MTDQEQLHFRIGLSAVFWEKQPQWNIRIDDVEVAAGDKFVRDEIQYIEFDHVLDSGKHQLKIQLLNKTDSDVKKDNYNDPNNFKIVEDMLLQIKSVEIDDIDLGDMIWSKTQFVAHDPQRPTLTKCTDLGWNGDWILDFESPFYLWLLESL